MSKNRILASLISNDTSKVKSVYTDSDNIVTSASLGVTAAAGTAIYSSADTLPVSATNGDQALVTSTNRLYIYSNGGWYNIALINTTPYWSVEASTTYDLSTTGAATTITILAVDSEGIPITYTATTDSDFDGIATITKDSDNGRIFTVIPTDSEGGTEQAGTGTVTFKASDGVNLISTVSSFSITFANIIASSAETKLLMKATGNTATNAAITHLIDSDNTSTDFVEQNGPEASTFTPYRSGGYSAHFDGANDRIEIAAISDLSATNYTIEMWVYAEVDLNSGTYIFMENSDDGSSGNLQFYTVSGGTTLRVTERGNGSLSTDVTMDFESHRWYHLAVVWDGTNTTIYVDGVSKGSSTNNAVSGAGSGLTVNGDGAGAYEWPGYIRDFRISTTARYTGNFTPPTEALTADGNTDVLLCHAPYLVDGSTNSRAITTFNNVSTKPFGPYDHEPWAADDHGGSVKFVSTSNIKTTATDVNAVGNTASSEYTIEGWVYMESYPSTGGAMFSKGTSGTTSPGDAIVVAQIRSAGAVYCSLDGNFSGSQITTADGTCPLKIWTHIALTKTSAGLHTLYVNGVSKGTYSNASVSMSASTNAYIGGIMYDPDAAARTLTGHVADVRVADEVIYTGAFTPPTAPVSQTANTTLLMQNKSDANIYDAAAANTLELNSGAQSSTTERKFTTSSSILINGTDDKVTIQNLGIGGDMTFEGWFMQTTAQSTTYRTLLEASTYTGTTPFGLFTYNTQVQLWGLQNGVQITGSFSQNTWHHVAVVRNSGTWTLYIDGTSQGTNTNNGTYAFADTTDWSLGAQGSNASDFIGYLQDWRFSNRAVYTTNFTAPTTEFEL